MLKVTPFITTLIAIFAAGFAFGIVLPVTSVILEEQHVATPVIGLMATAIFIGIALGAPLVGRSIELRGVRFTLTCGLSVTGICMLLLGSTFSLPLWFVVRFFLGIGFGAIFTSCETLINRLSTDKNRGKNLGLYGLAFSVALMAGPAGLWMLSFGTWLPFTVTGALCLFVATTTFRSVPVVQEHPPALRFDRAFVKKLRVSLAAMIMAGFMEGAMISLIPIYAIRTGFDPVQVGLLLLGFMLGHGALTPLLSALGDRLGLRTMVMVTYVLGIISFAAVFIIPPTMWLMPVLIFAGASVGTLYPLGVGMLAECTEPEELARGNAMTTFCYGLGSIVGPFVPAVVIHVFDAPASLFVVAAVLYITVFLWMCSLRRIRRLSAG
jgi:MFS family permease